MAAENTARGNTTRQANKERRRQRILEQARELIANQGYEAFTISELASRSQVSIPTIHNLFGKKHDIVRELCAELVTRIDQVMAQPELVDPVASAEVFIDSLLALYRQDEAFYRAAFVAAERTGLFEREMSTGIFKKSLQIAAGAYMMGHRSIRSFRFDVVFISGQWNDSNIEHIEDAFDSWG